MGNRIIGALVLALATAILPHAVPAQGAERSGKDIVEAVCASCHAKGVEGAPRIGDSSAWAKRASRGLTSLTQNALSGIRKMPSHGGRLELSDLEIGKAVTYMVNQSGGNWVEPASLKDMAAERSGAQVVRSQCAKCHQAGVGGAPRIGDRAAWTPRLKDGLDNVVRAAIHGHGGMPARGDQADLTDAEVRSAVLYMINPAAAAAKGAPATVRTAPRYKSAGGMEVYLGIVSAASLRAFPEGSMERAMHGGVPSGAGYYHVNISLLDAASKAPVSDAKVEIRVAQAGMSGESIALEPVVINKAPSYGNYVRMRAKSSYLLTVRIQKPDSPLPAEAKFEYRTY